MAVSTNPLKKYLALGDSYTIGEAVDANESFPFQLVSMLNKKGLNFMPPKIIAKTGWTTDELQAAISAENITEHYHLVTLLIGVNNQYRNYSKEIYRKEFKALLQQAVAFANGLKTHVFVISIPDWGVTPFGKNSPKNQSVIAHEIDAFNALNYEETRAAKVAYLEITAESRKALNNASLIAHDALHPSAKMYHDWAFRLAQLIAPVFKHAL